MLSVAKSLINESMPPKSKFSVDHIPDLSGKVMIVTGANTGVGYETAKALLLHNAKVYIAARSPEKSREAIKKLKAETDKDAIFLKLDLASLKAVKAAAEEFTSKENELHVLFNNGGVMVPPIEQLTEDGYDLQFGTNVLGHYYFTMLLLPVLLAGTSTSGDGKARVVNTSSSTHMFSNMDLNTFKDGPARKKAGPQKLYSQSKHGVVVWATELARRYGDQGIVSTALNPGNLKTELQRHLRLGFILKPLVDLVLYPVPYGALTQLYAGTSPEGKDFNGKYLIPWARMGEARADTQDRTVGSELWSWLEEQTRNVQG